MTSALFGGRVAGASACREYGYFAARVGFRQFSVAQEFDDRRRLSEFVRIGWEESPIDGAGERVGDADSSLRLCRRPAVIDFEPVVVDHVIVESTKSCGNLP